MPAHQIHFTLAEARAALAHVKPVLEEIVQLKRLLDAKGFDVYRHQYFGGLGPNGQRSFPAEMERMVALIRELDKLGILMKSLEEGLIDFPHIRKNGEEVYLCFKFGEEEIRFWHTIESGFAGRRPLHEL